MLYRIKHFLKRWTAKGSALWNALITGRRVLEKLERVRSRLLMRTLLPFAPIRNINCFEAKMYSQNGEDGILEAIFFKIGTTHKFAVEFGVEDGNERNTRQLWEKYGWTGLLMDPRGTNPAWIKREFVTAENINTLFQKYNVPKNFDLLSMDIDGNEYWVWKALDAGYAPRVVVSEYNAKVPPAQSRVIAYDPRFDWDGTDYFGASLLALSQLGNAKGYTLVGCDSQGINAFFVRNDLIKGNFVERDLAGLYRPPRYGRPADGGGWPASPRAMVTI